MGRQPTAKSEAVARLVPCSPLYVIVDPDFLPGRTCADTVRDVIAGGGRLIQLRMKNRSSADMVAEAEAVRVLTRAAGATLIVNDRVDVALAAGADGVHLGADDLPVEAARRLAGPRLLIGRSAHGIAEGRAAVTAGAGYVGFGPLYHTGTKVVGVSPQGLDRLSAFRREIPIPVIAIGGITESTAPRVMGAGADAVAILGDIARATDVTTKVRRLLAALA